MAEESKLKKIVIYSSIAVGAFMLGRGCFDEYFLKADKWLEDQSPKFIQNANDKIRSWYGKEKKYDQP